MTKLMKRIFTILTIAAAVVVAASCEKYEDGKPSKDVRTEFAKMYPNAWDVEWERYGDGNWVVSFETGKRPDGTDHKAFYERNGNWVQTITDVLLADVPQDIKNYLQESEYAQAQFEDYDAEYFETQAGDNFYRFDLVMGGRDIEVDVNTNGEVTPARYGYF